MAIYRDPIDMPVPTMPQLEPPRLECPDSPAELGTTTLCPSCHELLDDFFVDGLLECVPCELTYNVHTKMARANRRPRSSR